MKIRVQETQAKEKVKQEEKEGRHAGSEHLETLCCSLGYKQDLPGLWSVYSLGLVTQL